jgi:deoxyribodipyrimidine photolyase-related protein
MYIIKLITKKITNIQSQEAFIRQLFWREYCVLIYMFNKDIEKINFFNHTNNLHSSWYNGTTQFEIINNLINKSLTYGWVHHIERLMFIGNIMLLTQIKPIKVYKWFTEMFIDAYPWVMVPNIYGMSQFSCGSLMMKRPYFSSSNYIDKMSNYKKKPNLLQKININNIDYEWYIIWDCLYYNFINNNIDYFSKNYSTANIVNIWKKKTKKEQNEIIKIANDFIKY